MTLNVAPGLGAGYLYQRRWKAYWITSALATSWFVLGAVLGQGAEAAEELQNQIIGLAGLDALAGALLSKQAWRQKVAFRGLTRSPPLLKARIHLRRDAAEQLWNELHRVGWQQVEPCWGASAEP